MLIKPVPPKLFDRKHFGRRIAKHNCSQSGPSRYGTLAIYVQLSSLPDDHPHHVRTSRRFYVTHPSLIARPASALNGHIHPTRTPGAEYARFLMPRFVIGLVGQMNSARAVHENFTKPLRYYVLSGGRRAAAKNASARGGRYAFYHERQEDAEDTNRLRDSDTDARRVLRQSEEDREAAEALNSEGPPEEVASQTAPARRRGGYSAKRTRSGTSEDA